MNVVKSCRLNFSKHVQSAFLSHVHTRSADTYPVCWCWSKRCLYLKSDFILSTLCTVEPLCLHTLGIDAALESTLLYSLAFQLLYTGIFLSRLGLIWRCLSKHTWCCDAAEGLIYITLFKVLNDMIFDLLRLPLLQLLSHIHEHPVTTTLLK